MNIYMYLEVSNRELDSKLLLATLAASKGHKVIISGLSEIINGLKTGVLAPGIFHTKSLTPSKKKINTHQEIINNKSVITSIDEESGISHFGYDEFIKGRYSDLTIDQSSAVFCWGSDDEENLKKTFYKRSHKIFKTGNPRVDLWRSILSDYWTKPKRMPKKPFLLVSSNMESTNTKTFYEGIKMHKAAGYFERDPGLFRKLFYHMSDDYKKIYEFIEAIKYLAKNNNEFDIVLRPHPTENIKIWEFYLDGIPNVHVIKEDSITTWVKNSFAVMHNGCTTAIETSISGKPLLTYEPFEMSYDHQFANAQGYKINSKEDLFIKVNDIFNSQKISNSKKTTIKISKELSQKLHIDNNELAAEKIVKVWESISNDSHSKTNNWFKFYWFIKIINLKRFILKIMAKIFPYKFKPFKKNYKSMPFDKKDVSERVNRLQHILKIKDKIECKFLSKKTVLIKKT